MEAFIVSGVQQVVLSELSSDVDQPVLCDDTLAGGLAVAAGDALVARLVLGTAAGRVVVVARVAWVCTHSNDW